MLFGKLLDEWKELVARIEGRVLEDAVEKAAEDFADDRTRAVDVLEDIVAPDSQVLGGQGVTLLDRTIDPSAQLMKGGELSLDVAAFAERIGLSET